MVSAVKKMITPEGYEKAKQELDDLRSVKRREIAKRIEEAKALGDLSENAEYQSAREEQSFVEGRIAELEDLLKTAVVVTPRAGEDHVQLGATVIVESGARQREYRIVGSNEADPGHGLISHESPIGQAFLGRRAGDIVTVSTPKGTVTFKVLAIR